VNLEQLTKGVCDIATTAGGFIREERKIFDLGKVNSKGLNQLVSYVDIEAEKKIVIGLSQLNLDAGFITEEETTIKSTKELNWIIDPLDGTTNFIHDLPVFSVSIALSRGEEILLGVVYEVMKNECFYAWKGGGAWLNKKPIGVSKIDLLKDSLLATGFPYYDFKDMNSYLAALRSFMKETHGLRRLGSAAVDMAYTACGRFEGFFEYGLNAWDIAAGICIVKEAGGKVTDFKNGEDYLFGKQIVASNTTIHNHILKTINEHFK
jgi:myo-inositol-1(or 4)-monophosphatase